MANSGSARRSGSGNRRPPGTGNRSAATRRSGAPAAAKRTPTGTDEEAFASDKLSADERARERLSQPRTGSKRPPARGGSRPGGAGRTDPRKRRPQARSTGKTAGIFGGAFVVLAVIIILMISLLGGSSGKASKPVPWMPASTSLVDTLATVPATQFSSAGLGDGLVTVSGVFTPTPKETPITQGGKPVLVYIGAEYCPYCAGTRWPLVIALSRFGRFSGLGTTASSPYDVYAGTHTLSFWKAHYSSPYLAFDSTEFTSNACAVAAEASSADGPFCPEEDYVRLQPFTSLDEKLLNTYEGANNVSIPFLDWGGKFVSIGPLYTPGVINLGNSQTSLGWHPLSWAQIVSNIYSSKPMTPAGEAILGSANVFTGAICDMTHDRPGSVCDTPVVKRAQAELAKA